MAELRNLLNVGAKHFSSEKNVVAEISKSDAMETDIITKNGRNVNRHSIRNNFFHTFAICVSFVIILFVINGCDKDDPEPEGVITLDVRNYWNGGGGACPDGCDNCFGISGIDNFYGINYQFASVGKKSLGSIKSIPTSGWAEQVAVEEGYGYVGKCKNNDGNITYVRIYVKKYITSASEGGVIGATIQYQSPFNP